MAEDHELIVYAFRAGGGGEATVQMRCSCGGYSGGMCTEIPLSQLNRFAEKHRERAGLTPGSRDGR